MGLVKKPVTGMKDILPAEERLRNYVIEKVRETYSSFGFVQIETPVVEHIENLCSNQGGENEKLIFKILKRGEKLDLDGMSCENDLVDSGLRYDLTLPLSRYYANHSAELQSPFKALQIGSVFRADRPQKGRFRQFTQCDIDILGDPTFLAEIELIQATTTLLLKLGFKGFTVRINDRRILKAMAMASGIGDDKYSEAFIILDKMDKIGLSGVEDELLRSGFSKESVEKYISLFKKDEENKGPGYLLDLLPGEGAQAVGNLENIMKSVEACGLKDFKIEFDPTLVRGMSYYTGTIFEISMEEFGSSVAGGGRYDEMIGKFTGVNTSACGFSIGFERIITILMDKGFEPPIAKEKRVFLLEKGMNGENLIKVMKEAAALREQGISVLICNMNKNKKFQKETLMKSGYLPDEIIDFYHSDLRK